LGGLPAVGQKLIELAERGGGDAGQHVAEVGNSLGFSSTLTPAFVAESSASRTGTNAAFRRAARR
jgi:hypothetical protein